MVAGSLAETRVPTCSDYTPAPCNKYRQSIPQNSVEPTGRNSSHAFERLRRNDLMKQQSGSGVGGPQLGEQWTGHQAKITLAVKGNGVTLHVSLSARDLARETRDVAAAYGGQSSKWSTDVCFAQSS